MKNGEYQKLFIIDNNSEHGTWLNGNRLPKFEPTELKSGMTLAFGPVGEMSMNFRCEITYRWRRCRRGEPWVFKQSPARIEYRDGELDFGDLSRYMQIATRNYHKGLTPEGLFLLYKEAGMQHSFEYPISSEATVRIAVRVKRKKILFQDLDTKHVYHSLSELLSWLKTTTDTLMNKAYGFVGNEARSLFSISMDLQHRATKSILRLITSIDGVVSVVFSGPKVAAVVDPKKPKPHLLPLQRAVVRSGNMTFEHLVGSFTDDNFARGSQVAQSTNPLMQGISDLVHAETGTLGHFISTVVDE